MSDGDGLQARETILEGCAQWLDQWERTSGSVITGWVLIVESIRPDAHAGQHGVVYACGGGDPAENEAGLSAHRLLGIVERVRIEIQARIERAVWALLDLEEEGEGEDADD